MAAVGVGVGLGMAAIGSQAMAAERAYELVTPPHSNAEVRFGAGLSTADGDMVCFNAEGSLAGAPLNGNTSFDDGYCARRTATGWETEWVTGPAPAGQRRGNHGSNVKYLSEDGERVVFASDAGIVPDWPGGPPGTPLWGAKNGFLREAGETRWVTPTPDPSRETLNALDYGNGMLRQPGAASDDLRHGIFQSALRLLPEDQNNWVDVYEWTPDGIRLVSRDASGSAVGGYLPLGPEGEQRQAAPGAVSPDGSRVFYMAPAFGGPPGEGAPPGVLSIFMREGDELTHISPRLGPGPAADVFMEGAYGDPTVVYLSSVEQLTDEPKAACNAEPCKALYRYDVADDELSLEATHADGITFLGASEDGKTLVLMTNGGAPELIVRRNGVDTPLGTLAPFDTTNLFDLVATVRPDKRALRIAADGSSIVFASFAAFDGAPGTRQIFRWTPTDGVRWISRDAAGTPGSGMAAIGNYSTRFPAGLPRYGQLDIYNLGGSTGRVITDDGSRVFFETQDALVEGDQNGAVLDVYEWHDGEVSLVSPGTQTEDAYYHDSSADGSTVFFITRSRLIPQLDRTTEYDLYAARVGGGFPLPEIPPECVGEQCQDPPAPKPEGPGRPGSDAVQGSGDASERRRAPASFSLAALGAKQRRALAEGRRATLRVRVSRAGRVRLAAFARIGDRRVRVAGASGIASRRGAVRLKLRLSGRARGVLKQRTALRLSLDVTHSKSKRIVRKVVVLHG